MKRVVSAMTFCPCCISVRSAIVSALLASVIVWLVGFSSSRTDANDGQVDDGPADITQIQVEPSMHEFMEYVFQPTYKRLHASMQEKPADNNAWKPIKSDALILAESTNLLLLRIPDEDGASWAKITHEARQLAADLYEAAGKKDFDAATTNYQAMLMKCNSCHDKYAEGDHQLSP